MNTVAASLPGSTKDTAASDFPSFVCHCTVALFFIAALIAPCGVVQSWCVRSTTNREPGTAPPGVAFHAKSPLTYWSLRAWPVSG